MREKERELKNERQANGQEKDWVGCCMTCDAIMYTNINPMRALSFSSHLTNIFHVHIRVILL